MTTLLSLFLWMLAAQSANSIQGVVLRAGTTQPLANVQVGLWPTSRAVTTDAVGRFLFDKVDPGEYALTVVRDGIKSQTRVVVAAGRLSEGVILEVKSAPAIAGTVYDPFGERVAATRVQAFRMVHSPTGPRMKALASALTDDLGQFRLYHLKPGEYYISASLSDRDRRIESAGLRLTPNLAQPDEGFPPLYFGGGYSPFTAQKVSLGKDSDVGGVDVFLKEGPRMSISGRLTGDQGEMCGRMAAVPEGGFVNTDTDFSARVCGPFRIGGLSPGTYSIFATSPGYASDVVRVSVMDRNAENVVVGMAKAMTLTGRFPPNPAVRLPAGARVVLSRNSRDVSQRITGEVDGDGSWTIRDVGPGSYDVFVEPLPDRGHIRFIRFRGQDGLAFPIRIDTTASDRMDIQLAPSQIEVSGVVVDRSAQPVPAAEVVLVPRNYRNREDRYLVTTADVTGAFRITGIPPGTYAIFAFEEIDPGAYFVFSTDSRLYNDYLRRGQTLNLNSYGEPQLRLNVIPAYETAGGIR